MPHDKIFTKGYACTSDEQVEVLSRDYITHYRSCEGWMVYTLSKRVHLCFALYRLAEDFSNPGNVKFEGLVHLVRFIRDNKNLGFKYYAWIEDAPLSENFIQAIIKSDKQLMFFFVL